MAIIPVCMSKPDQDFEAATVEQPDPLAARRQTEKTFPEVRWRDAQGEHRALVDRQKVIGSASGADLCVADPAVSRLHAQLESRADGIWVRDLGSKNGTFIDAVRVGLGRVPEGGAIRLGSTVLSLASSAPVAVELWPSETFGPLVGKSHVMRELFALLARYAASDAPVLIQGETGTGKELIARAIHDASPRALKPFSVIDCAGIPESLLETELFGHAKGAFTGAMRERAGAVEEADGGTVFLDEIGELPLSMQPKLLRALESRTVRRIGESTWRPIDVRFVAATHRDLLAMVNAAAFREDLYFRLAVLPVAVAPLREHAEDIPLLIEHFLKGRQSGALAPGALPDLGARPWLGNVRELRNLVERASAVGVDRALALSSHREPLPPAAGLSLDRPFKEARELCLESFERDYLRQLLARHGGAVGAAAQAAGIDRTYLYRLTRKHGL